MLHELHCTTMLAKACLKVCFLPPKKETGFPLYAISHVPYLFWTFQSPFSSIKTEKTDRYLGMFHIYCIFVATKLSAKSIKQKAAKANETKDKKIFIGMWLITHHPLRLCKKSY